MVLFRLTQLVHIVIYLIVYNNGLIRYFKQNLLDGGLTNLTESLSVSYAHKVKSKLSLIKNPYDMHVHNSLSNVPFRIPCINTHCAEIYQLEMVFAHVYLSPIAMGNTLHRSDCI